MHDTPQALGRLLKPSSFSPFLPFLLWLSLLLSSRKALNADQQRGSKIAVLLKSDEMTSRIITIGKCSEHGSLVATLITSNNFLRSSRVLTLLSSSSSCLSDTRSIAPRGRPDAPLLRGFPEKNSRKILYVLMCARVKRARGDTVGRERAVRGRCPTAQVLR